MRRTKRAEAKERGTLEPLEPGGELGESREVGPGSSALRQPGRAPRTRVRRRTNDDETAR